MAEAHLVPGSIIRTSWDRPRRDRLMDKVPTPRVMALLRLSLQDGDTSLGGQRRWMAGVVGPCALAHPPIPYARGTFSRFEPYDSRTPEDHVESTHRAVIERRDRPR